MTKKQVREESVYLAYTSILWFNIERRQGRNSNRVGSWGKELLQRRWGWGASYWLAQPSFF